VIPGRRAVAEALRAPVALTEVALAGLTADDELVAAAEQAGVAVRPADTDELEALCGGVAHQGVAALGPAYRYAALDEVANGDLLVVLDGVTDPRNLGGIARSAEAAGACGLVVAKARSAAVSPAAEKAAAGALAWLPVARVPNLARALGRLADAGFWSVGLDGDAAQSVWQTPLLDGAAVVVVGAEGTGLSRLVAERVDERVGIPLAGQLGSLNAGAAAAIALFEAARRRTSRSL
jgi:23S rRNA (guanosine2251-2'-O)-methyltransferase